MSVVTYNLTQMGKPLDQKNNDFSPWTSTLFVSNNHNSNMKNKA